VLVKCETCGEDVEKWPKDIRKYKHHFCSYKCKHNHFFLPHVVKERFFKYVEKQANGCWLWTGYKGKGGYGKSIYKGKTISSHRLSWIIHNGEIPEGLFICHTCDVRSCQNPQHLFLASHQGNMDDMVKKGRASMGMENSQSKLTEKQVIKIRKLFDSGEYTISQLKEIFNVDWTAIKHVVTKKTWRHI